MAVVEEQGSFTGLAWVGSRAGISNEVLAPWTPIQVETVGKDVLIRPWGRLYGFNSMPFPSKIETAGRSILSAPIRLIARADGYAEDPYPCLTHPMFHKMIPAGL